MKLYLKIAVYRGGDYWKECWASVKQNLEFFEGVFISINYSDLQADDIALIQNEKSDKIHWIKQDKTLTAVAHSIIQDQWIRQFHLKEGHMFILCHDDILLRDGLLELQKLDLKEEDAVFGGHQFSFQNAPMHYSPITVHECCSMTGVPMKKELFFYLFEYRALNVSGIIIPASCWSHHKHMPWDLLSYGFWAEYCLLCMPEIKIIYQTISPLVKIRLHSESEGAKGEEPDRLYDVIFHYCHAFAAIRDEKVRHKMIIFIIYSLKDHPFRGLWYFIRIQWKMRKLDYYYPEAWKIYCYIFKKVLQKTIRLFARGAQ